MDKQETNGNGKAFNKPGLYRHPESGAEVVTRHDPKLGSAMSDAVVQVGYVWVGEAPKEPIVTVESAESKTPAEVKK